MTYFKNARECRSLKRSRLNMTKEGTKAIDSFFRRHETREIRSQERRDETQRKSSLSPSCSFLLLRYLLASNHPDSGSASSGLLTKSSVEKP
jgi:hypothetical protein